MASVIVAPKVRDLDDLATQLHDWLSLKMPQARDLALENFTYPSGAGRSHETILLDAKWHEDGAAQAKGMVVRIKPSANMIYPDELFDEQARLMQIIHAEGKVRVAHILWFEENADVLGAPFFVMERLVGRVAVSYPPYAQSGWVADATPAQRRKVWENGVRALASVQQVSLDGLEFLAIPAGSAPGLEQEFNKYVRFVDWISADQRFPVLDAVLAHLRARWPVNQPAGLVWGDARLGNLMFDDNFDVVAVMDWEQPSLGGALHDLAWWLYISDIMHSVGSANGHLEGMGTREETIALWQECTGISTADLDWYDDFTALRIGCLSVSTSRVWGAPLPDLSPLARRFGIAGTP